MLACIETCLFNSCKSDVWIPIEAAQTQVAYSDRIKRCNCLTRPNWVIQLVEDNERSFWHSGKKRFKRDLRGFIEIRVQIQQADNQVLMRCGKFGHCASDVSTNQFDLRDMAQ